MIGISDIQVNRFIVFNNAPHQVLERRHLKLGRGGAILNVKLRNLLTGGLIEQTFKGNEKIEEAEVTRAKATFLYQGGEKFNFMEKESFEQFGLEKDKIGKQGEFLKEGGEVEVLKFSDKPIQISLPIKLDLKVVSTEPGVKGNTAQGKILKPAKLETGAKIPVPLFVKTGDIIRINTETGGYVERVK